MKRQIELANAQYEVTLLGPNGAKHIQVNDESPEPVHLVHEKNGASTIRLNGRSEPVKMASHGDTTFIHAFGRTFTLRIIDPVEQAANDAGGHKNTARAPMPGMMVEVNVAENESVAKGQALATIESMKILTVIKAPRNGRVDSIHFNPGDSFDKNAVLVTLAREEE